jgi:hypothetical protein
MREHPTIPEIVQALVTLNDRHQDEIQKVRDEYCEANRKDRTDLKHATWVIDRRDSYIEVLKGVIEALCERIERTSNQLARDNRNCVYSEPLALFDLLGREYDPAKLIQRARDKWKADERRKIELAKKNAPEPCPTQFSPGMGCAGTVGHSGDCTPNADDIPSTQERLCRVCGHSKDRHLETLPEEGRKTYCAECDWSNEAHAFDGSPQDEDDVCDCGHKRNEHSGNTSLGGAQCGRCPGDEERSWRHKFFMQTPQG